MNRMDIVIKPADKGGAIVPVQKETKQLYVEQSKSELNYLALNMDPAISNTFKVKEVVQSLFIQDGELPQKSIILSIYANNVGQPCYFLPKTPKQPWTLHCLRMLLPYGTHLVGCMFSIYIYSSF